MPTKGTQAACQRAPSLRLALLDRLAGLEGRSAQLYQLSLGGVVGRLQRLGPIGRVPQRGVQAWIPRAKKIKKGTNPLERLQALNGPVLYQVRKTLERPEPQARTKPTLEGCDYQPVASKPVQSEQAPQVPSICKNYLSAARGPARLRNLETRRCEKTGALICHPARPY
jgi:hypothetical protein